MRSLPFRFLIAVLAVSPALGHAAPSIGQLANVGRGVDIVRDAREVTALSGSALKLGDALQTGPDSDAALRMDDDALIALSENTQFQILDYRFDPRSASDNGARYGLSAGSLRMVSGLIARQKPGSVVLETPYGVFTTIGTDYLVILCNVGCDRPGAYITGKSGGIRVVTAAGELSAAKEQFVYVGRSELLPELTARLPERGIGRAAPNPEPLLMVSGEVARTLRIEVVGVVSDTPASPSQARSSVSR